ncbi:MAG TPA: type II toxin-antitoxin system RelE/ParE family toxin [Kiloniellales bacterium]|nr:type II toxin-antitoxin system RelE/ParE family toxin [Kiloniellales bacterium]
MGARVFFSPVAESEIRAIGEYIARDNPRAAARFVSQLRERCLSLSEFPNRGRPFEAGSRVVLVGKYLIIYEITQVESEQIVLILTVRHGARDEIT